MMSEKEQEELEAAREIAAQISAFRREFWEKFSAEIESEVKAMESSGFDPTKGRGRGPFWAEGA